MVGRAVLCTPNASTKTFTSFALPGAVNYPSGMPTEISIPDAEDLKSRVRELRRFL